MAGKSSQTTTAADRQLRSKNNKVKTKIAKKKKKQQSPEDSDKAHNHKRTATIISKPNKK
jgi:hypothetical protein